MSLSEPLRDSTGRWVGTPHRGVDLPKSWSPGMSDEELATIWGFNSDLREQRKLKLQADRNARLEKTQECWGEVCNCSHRKK